MQRLDEVARSLGAGEALIARLVSVLWREYSEESMPDGYWSSQCRDGGELDLDPGSRRFP